jgi:drug/metabolite transporter (DMT)-like permease
MTPERMADLVARWVRFYTRDLPAPVARRRIDEIDADLHDHIAHERANGTSDRRIALSIASRMIRGLAADASWRGQAIARHSTPKEARKMSKTYRSVVRVALATACVLLVPLVAMQITDEVDWGVADFVLAGVLLGGTGLVLELAARKPGKLAYLAAAIGIGVAAVVLGEADDAPGLVLFGGLLIVGTVAMAFRTAQRSA